MTAMKEAIGRLTNAISKLEQNQFYIFPLDIEAESLPGREPNDFPPEGPSTFQGGSSKSQIDEVKSKVTVAEPITRKAGSVYNRLGSRHSLTPQRKHAEHNLKPSLEQTEPEMSALKKRIANL